MIKKYNEKEIVLWYKKGLNTKEIADKLGTYSTTIRRILIRNQVELRSVLDMARRYSRTNIFEENLSREEFYFLGLLITDGCISDNRITLGLKESDKYLLERFAKFMGDKVKVNSYFHRKHAINQYEVKVRNKIVCGNLRKLANFTNKTFSLELYIPLNFDILRGIIDGDGCTSGGYIQIFGMSDVFLNQIKSFLLKYDIESQIRKTKTCKVLTVHKQKDVLFLYDHLYYETDLFLERKRNNFGPLLKKFNRLYALNSGNHRQGILSETSKEGRAETIISEPKERSMAKG